MIYFVRIELSEGDEMSSDEDKPPAPPVRLTSNRTTDRGDSVASVDMRPLPKGKHIWHLIKPTNVIQLWFVLLIVSLNGFETISLEDQFVVNEVCFTQQSSLT